MSYKLDLKDKKLLYELDLNSRQSLSELGRKVGLSKNSVNYRISNLRKEGIIKRFHSVIDTGKLGYIGFRLYLNLQNTTPEKEAEIIDFLVGKEIVTWVASIEGNYDVGALILTKSIKRVNELWKELLAKYTNYIDKKLLTIMTRVSYFSRAYLLNLKSNIYECVPISEPEEEGSRNELDKTDKEILKILAPNSRTPIVDIAAKIGISAKTVISRIKNLEESKIIIGYKTVFDLEKMGYQYYKLHFKLQNVNREEDSKLRAYVKSHPNIIYDDEVLGGDNIEIEVQVKDASELRELIGDIKEKFGKRIRDYEIMHFLREYKYLFLPVKI